MLAITALAFSSDPLVQSFDEWFLREFEKLTIELGFEEDSNQDILIIEKIFETMITLGADLRGSTPHEFMVAFEQAVIESDHPPFMDQPFQQAVFDPFRMLAEMVAVVAYAEGDPHRAMQTLAFGSGDTDTVNAFLGTLMGIWFGESLLLQNNSLNADLKTVERVLTTVFQVNLNEHVSTFLSLRGESNMEFFA